MTPDQIDSHITGNYGLDGQDDYHEDRADTEYARIDLRDEATRTWFLDRIIEHDGLLDALLPIIESEVGLTAAKDSTRAPYFRLAKLINDLACKLADERAKR